MKKAVAIVLFFLPSLALADSTPIIRPAHHAAPTVEWKRTWDLPQEMNDQNSHVNFQVDTSLHTVSGQTSGLEGRVWLANPKDPLSIRMQISLPVKLFNVGNASRDKTLRQIMAEAKFPNVSVDQYEVEGGCLPQYAERPLGCEGKLKAHMTIRDITKDVELPYNIRYVDGHYEISGKIVQQWDDYNVEDPSYFIMRFDKSVVITYRCVIPAKDTKAVSSSGKKSG